MNHPTPFIHNTYIILDLPDTAADQIMAIRKRHRDVFRASLPAEITVAGSSGIGVLKPAQDPDEAFSIIDAIAAKTAPIQASFGEVFRFPGTDIFVFTLQDEAPFQHLHQQLAESDIQFQDSPFPYKPHCTLRSRSPITEEEQAHILSLRLEDSFVLDTLSVISLYRDEQGQVHVPILHTVKLTGA